MPPGWPGPGAIFNFDEDAARGSSALDGEVTVRMQQNCDATAKKNGHFQWLSAATFALGGVIRIEVSWLRRRRSTSKRKP